MPETIIESLDNEGRGVARHEGKAIFIEGALPQERVVFSSYRRKPNYELATASRILAANALRVEPRCRHFGICGGCSMQHLGGPGQAAAKQRVLEDNLWHIGRMRPEVIFPAIHGPSWAYRTRARLSVRRVPKKGGVLVGFHEKRSSFIADMDSCEVLPLSVSALLPLLRSLIGALTISDRLPQIEVAVGDGVTVLVLRILQRLTPEDESLLRDFAEAQVLSVAQKEYILAAQSVGEGHGRIIFRHIVPNILSPVIVQTTMGLANAILSAAALGFLGLGAIPPEPEWGAMLGDSYRFLTSGAWWAVLFPGLAIMFSVLGFNLLGDGLRDALDPKLRI